CDQGQSRAWTLAPLLVAAIFWAPHWLALAGPNALSRAAERLAQPIVDRLPIASTLRHAEGATDLVRPELLVRAIAPAIEAGADGRLRWIEREGTLLVVSNRPLSTLRIEVGGEAPNEIAARGGELANTTYRP